jgi:hypothetical protein
LGSCREVMPELREVRAEREVRRILAVRWGV